MVKRASELPVFEELFDLYFSGLGEIIKQASQAVQKALSMSDQEFQKFLDEVEEMLKKEGKKLSELAKQLLQNNRADGTKDSRGARAPSSCRASSAPSRKIISRARSRVSSGSTKSSRKSRSCASSSRRWTSAPS